MTEQYDIAADRHYRVAEQLETSGEIDDAAYHYGLVGENSLKHAMRNAGVANQWSQPRKKARQTPMGKHLPALTLEMQNFASDIHLFATGRIGARLQSILNDPTFGALFSGWSIDIRYADTQYTPVNAGDCQRWGQDARFVLHRLVLMV